MDTDKLIAFVAVADERSFSRAADELGVSEELLRRRVRDLELSLGHPLLAHTTGVVRLTPEGDATLPAAREAISALAAVGHAAASIGGVRGRVRLGMVTGAEPEFFPPLLARFVAEHPDIRLEITTGPSPALESRIADGSLDLAFIAHIEPSEHIRYSFTEPLVAFGVEGATTISVHDLAARPIIVLDANADVRRRLERAAAFAGAQLDVVAQVPTPTLALGLAEESLGVVVLAVGLAPGPAPVVLDHDGEPITVHVGIIAHPEHRSAATERLLAVLADVLDRS